MSDDAGKQGISPYLPPCRAMVGRRTVLLAAGAAALTSCSGATPLHAREHLAIDELLEAYARTGRFSGAALAARGGQTIYAGAFGLADRATGAENGLDTRFDPGSVAKPVLAAVILSLVEDGLIQLEQSPAAHLTELAADPWRRVTLEQLLSHTAGVVDHSDVEGFFDNIVGDEIERGDLLAIFAERPLLFEPGSQYRYSNFGYSLLAIVAERATGASYPDLLRERVFDPADMTQSRWGDCAESLARGYVRAFGGAVAEAPPSHASASLGAGDIVTTVNDLRKFESALSAGRIVAPDLVARMFTPIADDPLRNRAYGLGWEIYGVDRRPSMGHAGLALGSTAVIERDPAGDTFFAIISNVRDDDAVINNVPPPLIRRMQSDLRALLRGENVALPKRSLVEQFVIDWAATGYGRAMDLLHRREARSPGDWTFEPNEVVLAVFGAMWRAPADCEKLTLAAIARTEEPWLLYETLGDVRAERGDAEGALSAYRQALRDMPEREYLHQRVSALERAR